MRALAFAALVLLAAAGEASAQKRDVLIESDPPGADVYLNSKDDGSLCKTPCTIKAPVGEQILIVELANHVSALESLVVPRRGKTSPLKVKLVRAVGTLIVKGPEGARIKVGDDDKGKAPAKLEIDAGPHTITLTLNGKQVLQDLIEIEANEEVTVRGKDIATGGSTGGGSGGSGGGGGGTGGEDGGGSSGGEGGSGGGSGGEVSGQMPAPRRPRGKLVALSGLIDVGFRRFTYQNPTAGMLPNDKENGQVIAGPMLELWPGTIAGVHALRGLAFVARLQLPINKQPVEVDETATTMTTFWQSLEISVRHRWTFSKGTFEASAGFVRDQHQFNTNNTDELALVPDADYRSIRIGAGGSLRAGSIEPYLAIENRVVLSTGTIIKSRFPAGSSTSGLRGALGAHAKLGPLQARLEASLTRYAWTFEAAMTAPIKADGASDSIIMLSAGLGYAY